MKLEGLNKEEWVEEIHRKLDNSGASGSLLTVVMLRGMTLRQLQAVDDALTLMAAEDTRGRK